LLGRPLLCAAIAILVPISAGATIPGGAGAAKRDYGDAPDGRPAGYLPDAGLLGRFPTRRASAGPSHPGNGHGLILGFRSGSDRNSGGATPDPGDDGVGFERLRACSRRAAMDTYVNAKRLPRRFFSRRSARIYLNAWFDWNGDGDFGDGSDGCAPEWAVQNLALRPRALGRFRSRAVRVRFRVGRAAQATWARVTLTLGHRAPHSAGAGRSRKGRPRPYRFGETEDYLLRPSAAARARAARVSRAASRARASGRGEPPVFLGGYPGPLEVSCGPTPVSPGTLFLDDDLPDGFLFFIIDNAVKQRGFPFFSSTAPPIAVDFISPRRTPRYRIGDVVLSATPVALEKPDQLPDKVLFEYTGPKGPGPDEVFRIRVEFRQEGTRRASTVCPVVVLHLRFLGVGARQRRRDDSPKNGDPPPPRECFDRADNDGDRRIDYPADPGCEDSRGDREAGEPQCTDNFDNDGDNRVDHPNDPGCSQPRDFSEAGEPQCMDGLDNDGDSRVDHPNDPGCESPRDESESGEPQCKDNFDNDGDGKVDHPFDPGCQSPEDDSELDGPTEKFACGPVGASPTSGPPSGDEIGVAGHAITGSCNQNIAELSFELLDGGTYSSFIVDMPMCDFGMGLTSIECSNPNDLFKQVLSGQFGTNQPNPHCVKVTAKNASAETLEFFGASGPNHPCPP
jgi:hypothetical protein